MKAREDEAVKRFESNLVGLSIERPDPSRLINEVLASVVDSERIRAVFADRFGRRE